MLAFDDKAQLLRTHHGGSVAVQHELSLMIALLLAVTTAAFGCMFDLHSLAECLQVQTSARTQCLAKTRSSDSDVGRLAQAG